MATTMVHIRVDQKTKQQAAKTLAAAGMSMTTPSSSSTSAAPQAEEAARLPCLTMGSPADAATIVAMVDTFTVCAPSPPLPTRSVTGPAMLIGVSWASI